MNIREYYNLKTLQMDLKEYAQMAHIINSRKMDKGKNILYSDNYIYKVYWMKFDNWKIYDKDEIEESRELYDKRNKDKNN